LSNAVADTYSGLAFANAAGNANAFAFGFPVSHDRSSDPDSAYWDSYSDPELDAGGLGHAGRKSKSKSDSRSASPQPVDSHASADG
jgi:hypothetical protein